MIDDDPFAPPVKKAVPLEQQLENASIDELEFRIERLKAEIAALRRGDQSQARPARRGRFRVRRRPS